MSEAKVLDLNTKCRKCRREIPEGAAYYKHPKYGIVCEYCPEFADGGISVAEEEEDLYIWIRRFESEAEREKLYQAVYEDPHWTEALNARVGEIIDRENIVVTRMLPTGRSVIH